MNLEMSCKDPALYFYDKDFSFDILVSYKLWSSCLEQYTTYYIWIFQNLSMVIKADLTHTLPPYNIAMFEIAQGELTMVDKKMLYLYWKFT